jgi:hypothetical protein
MTACEAKIVARVASTTSGIAAQAGASLKNGLTMAPGSVSSSAPWPK